MKKLEILTIIILLLIDQTSKFLMADILTKGSITLIPNFWFLEYTTNTGAAWSIFENNWLLLVIVSLMALFLLVCMYPTVKNTPLKSVAYPLLCAGIIGNLLDRIVFHYVRDFIKVIIFGYHFPIFNLADVFIVSGVFLLIIVMGKEEKNGSFNLSKKRKNQIR